jgi:aspartyl-tRNA synthetase
MQRTLTRETPKKIGEKVLLKGWVDTRRDHGKLVFIDLRDRTGIVQVVGGKEMSDLGNEYVVAITGKVKERPEKLINPNLETGKVEVEAEKVEVLAKAKELPFPINTEGLEIDEAIRLKYRYLDIRRKRMINNLRKRAQMAKFVRDWMTDKEFLEIETPILTKATPEGSRDFIVPSRMHPGNFYALPQSPQQYKQLLMVAGVERYFQIPKCLRDEDPRADRAYGEFTQVDIEMSFTEEKAVRRVAEDLTVALIKEVFPDKKIAQVPFPEITYAEAMKKYGIDRPDIRKAKESKDALAFCWVVDFPVFEWKEGENRWDAVHHPFTMPKKEFVEEIIKADPKKKGEKVFAKSTAQQYDLVCNGYEVAGGSVRITDPELQSKIFQIMGHTPKQVKDKFGHLLEAFEYGVPPHGGIAFSLGRLLMAILREPSIREVIAFPAAASGKISVMDGPSQVDEEQLKEAGIQIRSQNTENRSQE